MNSICLSVFLVDRQQFLWLIHAASTTCFLRWNPYKALKLHFFLCWFPFTGFSRGLASFKHRLVLSEAHITFFFPNRCLSLMFGSKTVVFSDIFLQLTNKPSWQNMNKRHELSIVLDTVQYSVNVFEEAWILFEMKIVLLKEFGIVDVFVTSWAS